jgi:hypothetical protein
MKEKEEKRAVFVRGELYCEVEEREDATGFGCGDEYSEFLLEEVVDGGGVEWEFNEEGEKEVMKRLADLGYLY